MTKARTLADSLQYSALTDGGLQLASFTAVAGKSYTFPTGGTVTLPTPTGSRRKMKLSPYGDGVVALSGTTQSTTQLVGDNTYELTDSDVTRGWV